MDISEFARRRAAILQAVDEVIGQDKGIALMQESDREAASAVLQSLMEKDAEILDVFHQESLATFENRAKAISGVRI